MLSALFVPLFSTFWSGIINNTKSVDIAQQRCLYVPNWIAPVLLTAEQSGDGLQMKAYTGRSLLFGQIRCRIALWILEQRLPEGITCVGKNKTLDKKEVKQKEAKQKESRKKKRSQTN